MPSLNRPRRTSGPFVSSNSAIGLLTIIAASRTICMRSACSSWDPWEKLKRATFMPARIISSKIPNLSVPGPTVHTIFVRFIFPPMKAPPRLDLSFLIISMLVKAIYASRNICFSTPFIYLCIKYMLITCYTYICSLYVAHTCVNIICLLYLYGALA